MVDSVYLVQGLVINLEKDLDLPHGSVSRLSQHNTMLRPLEISDIVGVGRNLAAMASHRHLTLATLLPYEFRASPSSQPPSV